MAALWGVPVEHLQVAAAICYDGTPAYQERHWAATTGWHVREFRVTWDSARALLDRGIAFTLTTQEPGSAHLQAVVGYDERRGTLLVRDPSTRYQVEFDAEGALAHYASCGPRGMALVPVAEAARLDAVELPEAELYDGLHRLEAALVANDRGAARAVVEDLERAAPGHRLTLQARRRLAGYDDSTADALAALEGLRAAFPDDLNLLLSFLGCLAELGRREERVRLLRERVRGAKAHPMAWHALAAELLDDAREEAEVERLLTRTLRSNPAFAPTYRTLAQLRWSQLRRDEALRLFRAAACLEDKDESNAWNYFHAARETGDTARALSFLGDRFRRFGASSGGPANTLFQALEALERGPEAFGVLQRARALRPEDGELSLFAARAHAGLGQTEEAERHLAAAEGRVRDGAWFRAAAAVAAARGALEVTLGHWEAVLAREPLALDAHSERVSLLTALKGVPEAGAHLEAACARFPHHQGLLRLRARWAREHDAAVLPAALEALLASHPEDTWALREHAWVLCQQGRREEALAELERSRVLEPRSAAFFHYQGLVLESAGRTEEAAAAYRESLKLFPAPSTVVALLGLATTPAARGEACAFVQEVLRGVSTPGDSLLAFESVARGVLTSEALGGFLAELRERHPEDWATWVSQTRFLLRDKRLDEALKAAEGATARFPLLGEAWLERALVHRARGELAAEREALEAARRLRPGWVRPACELSDLLERTGAVDEARAVLERIGRECPLDAVVQGYVADLRWRAGERDEALERLFKALRLDPAYGWAWERVGEWAEVADRREDAVALARELAGRPNPPPMVRWRLAELLEPEGESTLEERLALLDAAREAAPRLEDVHDTRARMLALAGRHDAALEACAPAVYGGSPPLFLRGRAAWVRARRGELREAMAAMQALLEESPDYGWGWHNLSEWAEQAEDAPVFLRAAEAMVRLRPELASAHGSLADARLMAGDAKGSCAAWARAQELEPDNAYVACRYSDTLLELGRLEEAERAVARARGHCPEGQVTAREARLAALRGDAVAAERHLARTVEVLSEGSWPLDTAMGAMRARGWDAAVERVLDAAMQRLEQPPEVLGRAWGHLKAERWATWLAWKRLRALVNAVDGATAPGRRVAWTAYVEGLGEKQRSFVLWCFVRLHRGTLRRHTELWGAVGYALLKLGRMAWGHRWQRDWRERAAELKPWMLSNVSLAAYSTGRKDDAAEAVAQGLALPEDHTRTHLRVWHAFFTALRGEDAQARRALEDAGPEPTQPLLRFVHRLAQAVRVAHESGGDDARTALVRARLAMPDFREHALGSRAYREAEAQVRRAVGWRTWLGWWLRG
ncbi:tetratricopeptide repeat protein [Pyxidicoccus sp. QH1ED-7-1]|nr:tetratricopeptide repeat protein [Pyxidicoccus xibeiensis]